MKSRGTAQGLEHGILSTAWLMGLAHMLRLSVIPRCRARKTFSLLGLPWLGGIATRAPSSNSAHWWMLKKEEELEKQLGYFS